MLSRARAAYVTSERLISRTHFARFLIDTGYVRDMKDAFKRYLTPGQAGLRAARVGDAGAGGRLDPRRGRPGRDRASGPLQAHAVRNARAGRRIPRPRRRCARSRLAVAYAGAVHGVRGARAQRTASRRRAAPISMAPGESRLDFGDLPPLPAGVDPVWSTGSCVTARAPMPACQCEAHRLLHFRPHRHHGGDARQQPADAIRGHSFSPRDDSVRRFDGEGRRRRAPGQRDGRSAKAAGRSSSARSSTKR